MITTVDDSQTADAIFMALEMMDRRLSEDALRGLVPFFEASWYEFEYSRGIRAVGLSVSAEASQLDSSVESLLAEVVRAEKFGFTDAEFDRALEFLVSVNEQLRDGQGSRQDSEFAAEYVEHFLTGAPIASIDQWVQIQNETFERLTRQDVERAFADLMSAAPRLFVVGPDEPSARSRLSNSSSCWSARLPSPHSSHGSRNKGRQIS